MGGDLFSGFSRWFSTQRNVQPRNFIGEEGEIFRPGYGLQHFGPFRAGHGLQHRLHFRGQLRIVVRDRVGGRIGDFNLNFRAHGLRHSFGNLVNPAMDQCSHITVQGPYGPHHFHLFRDDVGTHATVDTADRNDPRLLGQFEVPAHDGLKGIDDLCGNDDRIDAHPGRGSMSLHAMHRDFEIIDTGVTGSCCVTDKAGFLDCVDVQGERGVNGRIFKHAFGHHQFRTAVLPLGRSFFCRLKNKFDRSRQIDPF